MTEITIKFSGDDAIDLLERFAQMEQDLAECVNAIHQFKQAKRESLLEEPSEPN